MSTIAYAPASFRAICDDPPSSDSGAGIADVGVPARVLSYGRILGQVYKVARTKVVVAAGAPGTTTVDLAALLSQDGTALGTGTIVVIETFRTVGSEHAIRRSAANPVPLASGTTDTILGSRHQVLVDAVQGGTLATDAGVVLSATSKNITIESTNGATIELFVGTI